MGFHLGRQNLGGILDSNFTIEFDPKYDCYLAFYGSLTLGVQGVSQICEQMLTRREFLHLGGQQASILLDIISTGIPLVLPIKAKPLNIYYRFIFNTEPVLEES